MKKMLTMLLAVTMLMSMAFASTASAAEITNWREAQTVANEITEWNVLRSQGAATSDVLTNCFDGLLTNDPKGALVGNAAKEWYTNDGGKTWTFILNEGMNWTNQAGEIKAEVTSEDWVTGLEFVLNFAKNESYNVSMPTEMIVGALDYYNYTKELAETEGDEAALALGTEKFLEMVGIETPDKYTIVYHCTDAMPYFASVATYNCLYPLAAGLIEELGGAAGYQEALPENLWYSGPYTITEFVHNNEKVLTPTPNYWNADNVKRFDSITIMMVESQDVMFTLFQTGEIDTVELTQSNLSAIYNSESSEFYANLVETRPDQFARSMYFNFFKNNEDGTPDTNWNAAAGNEAFRMCFYYGVDWTTYLARTNAINPLSCQNWCYTSKSVAVTSDGTDYTDLVMDKIGIEYNYDEYIRYDAEKGAAYKAQAIEELTAEGVTFPIEIDYYIAGSNQTSKDTADVLGQMFTDYLGEDFIKFNIKTYISSASNEVYTPQLHSIYFTGWGADFADPVNFLGQMTYNEPNALFANEMSNVEDIVDTDLIASLEEFTSLVNAGRAIVDDLDARYAAFADAEAYMIQHGLIVPVNGKTTWQLTCVNDYSKIYSAYGIQGNRYVNWETNDQIYTTEEYAAFAK